MFKRSLNKLSNFLKWCNLISSSLLLKNQAPLLEVAQIRGKHQQKLSLIPLINDAVLWEWMKEIIWFLFLHFKVKELNRRLQCFNILYYFISHTHSYFEYYLMLYLSFCLYIFKHLMSMQDAFRSYLIITNFNWIFISINLNFRIFAPAQNL